MNLSVKELLKMQNVPMMCKFFDSKTLFWSRVLHETKIMNCIWYETRIGFERLLRSLETAFHSFCKIHLQMLRIWKMGHDNSASLHQWTASIDFGEKQWFLQGLPKLMLLVHVHTYGGTKSEQKMIYYFFLFFLKETVHIIYLLQYFYEWSKRVDIEGFWILLWIRTFPPS